MNLDRCEDITNDSRIRNNLKNTNICVYMFYLCHFFLKFWIFGNFSIVSGLIISHLKVSKILYTLVIINRPLLPFILTYNFYSIDIKVNCTNT